MLWLWGYKCARPLECGADAHHLHGFRSRLWECQVQVGLLWTYLDKCISHLHVFRSRLWKCQVQVGLPRTYLELCIQCTFMKLKSRVGSELLKKARMRSGYKLVEHAKVSLSRLWEKFECVRARILVCWEPQVWDVPFRTCVLTRLKFKTWSHWFRCSHLMCCSPLSRRTKTVWRSVHLRTWNSVTLRSA